MATKFNRAYWKHIVLVALIILGINVLGNASVRARVISILSSVVNITKLQESPELVVARKEREVEKKKAAKTIDNILSNRDVVYYFDDWEVIRSWSTYRHPVGLFTIKYNPELKPVSVTSSSMDLPKNYSYGVKFVPVSKQSCCGCGGASEMEVGEFYINIDFHTGENYVQCEYDSCHRLFDFREDIYPINIAGNTALKHGEEFLGSASDDFIKFGLIFTPLNETKYYGVVTSYYKSLDQRNVISTMISTMELNKEMFMRAEANY